VIENIHSNQERETVGHSERPFNPYAFPSHGSMGEVAQEGMSLRDYLAAHAPAEHWPHFAAVVPSRPSRPSHQPIGNEGELPTELESRMLEGWRSDSCWDARDELPKFSYWIKSWEDYWSAMREWQVACVQASHEQWPWFYADAMLKARAHG
jgi:hypothetical protein